MNTDKHKNNNKLYLEHLILAEANRIIKAKQKEYTASLSLSFQEKFNMAFKLVEK